MEILSDIRLPAIRTKSDIMDEILYKTAAKYNVTPADILRRDRSDDKVFLRYEVSKQATKQGFTQKEIAELFGICRTSVSHLLNKYRPPYKYYLNGHAQE